jgi:Domain of unknown function (DUF4388)
MSLSGNLRTMPFSDLLQFLNSNNNTGTLQVRKKQILKMIYFEKGAIISSSSSDPREYLGHFLVSQGLINEEELRMAMDVQRNSKMLLGKILVMGGKVDEDEMTRLLRLKTEETVYSLFLWDEGDFTFHHDEFIDRFFIRIHLDPQSLIFEGVLRRDEWVRIREVFPHNNILLEVVPECHPEFGPNEAQSKAVFALVDGRQTIDHIVLKSHSTDYPVCRALFESYEHGFLRIKKILDPPTLTGGLGGVFTSEQLTELGRSKLKKEKFEEAVDILRQIEPSTNGYQEKVAPLLAEAEKEAVAYIYANVLPADKNILLAKPLDQVSHAGLTPEEGFLLSRIDGTWDVRSILSVTPIKEYDALRLLKRLLDRGIITLPDSKETG